MAIRTQEEWSAFAVSMLKGNIDIAVLNDGERLKDAAEDLLAALMEWKKYMENNGGAEAYSFHVKTNAAIARATA